MNERYDRQMAELQTSLRAAREREQLTYETATLKGDVKMHIGDLVGREVDESFCKSILDTITVYPERRVELRLNLLPQKWRFVLDSIADIRHRSGAGCHYDPSVPISVSKPFNSSKGMEYRCDKYRSDAPNSPSGPPYCEIMIAASRGLGLSIFTGYCSFLS